MSKNLPEDLDMDDIIENLKKNVSKNKNKTNPTKKINFEKEPQTENINYEKKYKNEIFGDGILDYYKIIGASQNDSQEVINRKCNQKLAEYHHDKIKSKLKDLSSEESIKMKKIYEAQYDLVREARSVLTKPENRKYYDIQKKNANSDSFINNKDSFENFKKLQDSQVTEENKEMVQLDFKKKSKEMSKKHGFDDDLRMGQKDYHMDKSEFKRRIEDEKLSREQQDVNYLPKNIFEHRSFNITEFNEKFDMWQKKKEKKNKDKGVDKSIVQWEDVAAYNDHGANGGNYMAIDDDGAYEDLYKKSKGKDYLYADNLDSDDDQSLDSFDSDIADDIDISYVEGHNKNKKKTVQSYDKLIKERENEAALYEKRDVKSDLWKPVTDNPFNISHQMGEIVGNDIMDKNNKKASKSKYEAYKALMQDEKFN